MTTNKDIYTQFEFDQWADRQDLEPGEVFMIKNYLAPQAATLEAGSGGGRLLLAMQAAGFTDLHGFDFVPEFVAAARKRDVRQTIDFQVQDATQLDYADASFDQLVYLQQVLCLIPGDDGRQKALAQAYRILRPGGTIVISLLSNRERGQSFLYRFILAYLYLYRTITFSRVSMQYLPWLRLAGKPNWSALLDKKPHIYWYDGREAEQACRDAGFQVLAVGSDFQINQGRLLASAAELERAPFVGRLYLVCRK